jgi:hypothetical protein
MELKNAKKLGQFAASKLNCFKTVPSRNENHGNETEKKFLRGKISIFIPWL